MLSFFSSLICERSERQISKLSKLIHNLYRYVRYSHIAAKDEKKFSRARRGSGSDARRITYIRPRIRFRSEIKALLKVKG